VAIILLGEYVAWRQPRVWRELVRRYLVYLDDWESLMREPPLPGRAGLLPEEMAG
jgi:hypothetical protein